MNNNPTTHIPEDLMRKFTQFIEEMMGLHFKKDSWKIFKEKFNAAVIDFGFQDTASCMEWLMRTKLSEEQVATLAYHLTVGETYFFRDKQSFKMLYEIILPQIIEKKRKTSKQIRIWSTACCTGEEPYSIAILLNQLLKDKKDWNISILATDINTTFLHLAQQAVYKEWSFRATPEEIKRNYFKTQNNRYILDPEIVKMVEFKYLNLVEDSYPSIINETNAMDIILCNNVLIYFSEATIRQVVSKLTKCLVEDGYLVVSAVEAPFVTNTQLKKVESDTIASYKKITAITEKFSPTKITKVAEELNRKNHTSENTLTNQKNESLKVDYQKMLNKYKNGKYDEVIYILEDNICNSTDTSDVEKKVLLLIKSYGNIGSLDKALFWCERAIMMNKLDPNIYFIKAMLLQEKEQYDEAITSLKSSVYLNANQPFVHYILGSLCQKEGNNQEAKRHYRNACVLLDMLNENDYIEGVKGITVKNLRDIILKQKEQLENG